MYILETSDIALTVYSVDLNDFTSCHRKVGIREMVTDHQCSREKSSVIVVAKKLFVGENVLVIFPLLIVGSSEFTADFNGLPKSASNRSTGLQLQMSPNYLLKTSPLTIVGTEIPTTAVRMKSVILWHWVLL